MAWEPDYIGREMLKAYLTSGAAGEADTSDNDWLDFAITAGSRAVDRECSKHRPRQFGLADTPDTRYYTPRWSDEAGRWVCEIDDLMVTDGLVVALDVDQDDTFEVTVPPSGYVLRPRDAPSKLRPYTQLAFSRSGAQPAPWPDSVAVTSRPGWTAFPVTVVQASLIQSSRFFQRKESPFGVKGSPDSDSEEKLMFEADPDVKNMLRSYVRLVETP